MKIRDYAGLLEVLTGAGMNIPEACFMIDRLRKIVPIAQRWAEALCNDCYLSECGDSVANNGNHAYYNGMRKRLNNKINAVLTTDKYHNKGLMSYGFNLKAEGDPRGCTLYLSRMDGKFIRYNYMDIGIS